MSSKLKVVLKENGRVYEAIPVFPYCKRNEKGRVVQVGVDYLDPRTNTIRIKNEYGKETFVYPKEIDWEATNKLIKEQQEVQNNGETKNH